MLWGRHDVEYNQGSLDVHVSSNVHIVRAQKLAFSYLEN